MVEYADTDRIYHGRQHYEYADDHLTWEAARIVVESPVEGPTQHIKVLGELRTPADSNFGWGYDGGGPGLASAALLADALNVPFERFWGPEERDVDRRLRDAFCADVLMHACDEWRLRRGAVLRWARGWYSQYGIIQLPLAVADLPPVFIDRDIPGGPER